MLNDTLEYRAVMLELAACDTTSKKITGRAIVYNSLSEPLAMANGDTFREMILPGALTNSIKNNDIRALKEHNPAMLLGRTSAGTLILEDRADGLYVSIDVPDTSFGRDLLVSAARNDIRGFSFGFKPIKQRTYSRADGKIRELSQIDVKEVSVVSNPAYSATTMALRAEDFVEVVLDKEKGTEKREEVKETIVEKKDHSKELEVIKWKQRLRDINEQL